MRKEFVLLCDILGVPMRAAMDHCTRGTSTQSTSLRPFRVVESPRRERDDDIDADGKGVPRLVSGRATVHVGRTDEDVINDVEQPGTRSPGSLRGPFTTDHHDRFSLRCVVPRFHRTPDDGPAGRRLASTGRHPHRPARLDSDAVSGIEENLVREVPEDDPVRAAEAGLANPLCRPTFDVSLLCADRTPS